MNSVKLNAAATLVMATLLFLFIAVWYLSPRIYASSLISAAQARDLGTIVKRVDVARVTASSSDELTEKLSDTFRLQNGALITNALRTVINESLKVIAGDDSIFADKFANLVNGRGFVSNTALAAIPREIAARRTPAMDGDYGDTFDTYIQRVAFKETGEALALMMERDGWFKWRVVSVKMNSPSALLPFAIPTK
jgi:hypothetical protein